MTDAFLPTDYQVPSSSENYMKWELGENRFRILASPVLGNEWWVDGEKGRKPERRKIGQPVPVAFAEEIKHFWAMPVWNYRTERIQILEITQKGIQKTISGLAKDPDWGSPLGYDLVVSKSGEGMNTEYQVTPKPAKSLDKKIELAFDNTSVNLEALFEGKDPFEVNVEVLK